MAQVAMNLDAIIETAMGYFERWFAGNAALMDRALRTNLNKHHIPQAERRGIVMSNRQASTAVIVAAVILLVAVQNYFARAAAAEKWSTVTFKTMSPDDLKKKCGAAGGSFDNFGTDWSCTTNKGSVSCNDKSCTGVTAKSAPAPKQLRDPETILGTFSAQ